jgi:hypothetical protein
MSVKEMKESLLKRIQESDDELIIQEVYDLLLYRDRLEEEERSGQVFKLSDAQRTAIRKGQEQIARGEYLTDEEAEADLDIFFRDEEIKWGEK